MAVPVMVVVIMGMTMMRWPGKKPCGDQINHQAPHGDPESLIEADVDRMHQACSRLDDHGKGNNAKQKRAGKTA